MIRLAWRLAAAGGRSTALTTALTAVAVAFGTAILLFALSFEPALIARYAHAAWRDTPGTVDLATANRGLMLARTDDHWQGRSIVRMDVAALSPGAPVPPGLDHVPAAGETFVSPALASLAATVPPDQLAARLGQVVGTIGEAGLMAPDEIAMIVGRDPDELRVEGARVATALDGTGRIPVPSNPLIQLLVVLAVAGALTPVAVFVATATRLSAARREQRLAALRLAGATPGQVTVFAAVEALAATIPGALGGVLLFLLLRPLVAMIPLAQATWFPGTIVPPLVPALALLVVVQVVGVAAAVVALRRVASSPLGVRRRERRGPLRRLRLVPMLACLVVFVAVVVRIASSSTGIGDVLLWLLIGSFLGIIVGIGIAGPWVTMLVGAAVTRISRGPVGLLAGRRLTDDPRSAYGAIGGMVMAVFVGSTYLSIASFTSSAGFGVDDLAVRPDVLLATVPGERASVAELGVRAAVAAGALEAVELREVLIDADGAFQQGIVVSCPSFVEVLAAPTLTCGPGLVHLGPGGRPFGSATLLTMRFLGGPGVATTAPVQYVSLSVDPAAIDRYAPATVAPGARPGLPAAIIDPTAFPAGMAAFAPTRIAVLTDGSPAAVEQARTALEVAMPTSVVLTIGEVATDSSATVTELGRVVSMGVIVAMLLAGASLAIAVASGLVERRLPFALLRLSGIPLGRLRAVLLLEAAAPLVAVAILSALLGTVVAQVILRALRSGGSPGPDLGVIGLLTVATAGAMGVVMTAMPLVGRVTASESTRFE